MRTFVRLTVAVAMLVASAASALGGTAGRPQQARHLRPRGLPGKSCTKGNLKISLPDRVQGHAAAPATKPTSRPKQVTTKVVVDADGHGVRDGTITQAYRL